MAIASKIQDYMTQHGVEYQVLSHPHSHSSMETAQLAGIPGVRLMKSVVLEDDDGFVMAVLPSTHHVRLGHLSRELNRRLHLATEDELPRLFGDCELGAIPPLGLAYGMRTVIDDAVADAPEIYFEAGDHERLIRMSGPTFMSLMEHAGHTRFGERM
jgi:Ala-tRNA(Pro) deacylase